MTKFLPYQQYDVQAIENWLNGHAQRGLRLVKMDGVFPKFKRNYDRMVYYRVRYAPKDPPKGHAFYWGDLYIYEAEDPADLPNPNYAKGSVMAANAQKKPWYALALLICALFMAWTLLGSLSEGAPAYLISGGISVAAQAVWLVCIWLDRKRSRSIADSTIDPAVTLPNPKTKAVHTAASIVAFAAAMLAVLIGEGII